MINGEDNINFNLGMPFVFLGFAIGLAHENVFLWIIIGSTIASIIEYIRYMKRSSNDD